MKRPALVAAAIAALVVAVAVVALARRHDSDGGETVASVAGRTITRHQLDLAVEHFHEEADREGRPFPDEGTAQFRQVERQSLGLLVARAELEVAARRLGIHVTDAQVERRLAAGGAGGEEGAGDIRIEAEAAFRRSTARTQLLTEAVFREVTAGIRVTRRQARAYYSSHRRVFGNTPFARLAVPIRSQLLAARRNAAMTRWRARAHRSLADETRYEID